MTDLYVLDTSAIFTFTDHEDGDPELEALSNEVPLLSLPFKRKTSY